MELFNPKVLVIGAGSMGNRRIRNMNALGINQIGVFDFNEARLDKFRGQKDFQVFGDFDLAIQEFQPDALVICTPPNKHFAYVAKALELRIPSFLEASVEEFQLVANFSDLAKKQDVFVAPSSTMRHFNFAEKIREIVLNGVVGSPLYVTYHVGQYLPDWHPWEDINDFYVSNPSTAACKEIVPFELTWLCEILADYEPAILTSVISRSGQINAPIDDLYNALFKFNSNCLLNLTIEILSKPSATRKFHLVGTNGTISYDALTKELTTQTSEPQGIEVLDMSIKAVDGYIYSDQPYEKEMAAFFSAIEKKNGEFFPNDLDRDAKVLKLLQKLEEEAVKIE